jgi:hypothetical protein
VQAIADLHDTFALKDSAIEVVPSNEAGKADVIEADVLDSLLDRSWGDGEAKNSIGARKKGKRGKAMFEVFDGSGDADGGSNLAKIFGEDIQ